MSEAMERNPSAVEDPVERARLLFTQWHIDEVTGDSEAADYANRLIEKLRQYGLTITHAPTDLNARHVQRSELAGFDMVGRRLPDGRLQLGADGPGEIIDDWPKEASLGAGFHTYTLEEVKKQHAGPNGEGIEWGIYV